MKNKHLLLAITLFTSIFFNSCSKDDDGNEQQQTKLLDRATVQFANSDPISFTFQYNADNTLQKVMSENSYTVAFEYTADAIKMSVINGQNQESTRELKSENGIFTEFLDSDGQTYSLDYNPQTDIYSMEDYPFWFDDSENLLKFYERSFEYNQTQKGTMYNVSNRGVHFLLNMMYDHTILFMTSKPLSTFTDGSVTANFANEFDDDGYLIKAIQSNPSVNNPVVFNFSYILK